MTSLQMNQGQIGQNKSKAKQSSYNLPIAILEEKL